MTDTPYDIATLTGLGVFSWGVLGAVASALCDVLPPTLWLVLGACGVAVMIVASTLKARSDGE